jgi:hypothetical protein
MQEQPGTQARDGSMIDGIIECTARAQNRSDHGCEMEESVDTRWCRDE